MKKKTLKLSTLFISIGYASLLVTLLIAAFNFYMEVKTTDTTEKVLNTLIPQIPHYSNSVSINHQTDNYRENPKYSESNSISYYELNPEIDMSTVDINNTGYVGILNIPAIGLELPVIDVWNYSNLNFAPCRYSGTAYNGNFVICAHSYQTHFGKIGSLREGDTVTFTDIEGNKFEYEVLTTDVLNPTDIDEMLSEDYDLTLFTCNFSGKARITVRCKKIID